MAKFFPKFAVGLRRGPAPVAAGRFVPARAFGLAPDGSMSAAEIAAGNEPNVMIIDFTDDHFAASGHHGSVFIRTT